MTDSFDLNQSLDNFFTKNESSLLCKDSLLYAPTERLSSRQLIKTFIICGVCLQQHNSSINQTPFFVNDRYHSYFYRLFPFQIAIPIAEDQVSYLAYIHKSFKHEFAIV